MRYLALALAACVHRPPTSPDAVALAAAALDVAAMVVEVEAADAGPVGCVVGPVVGAAARSGAALLRGGGNLQGFTVDPTSCGVTAPSVPVPEWLPVVLRVLGEAVPVTAPAAARAAVEYVAGAAVAVAVWASDTTQPIVVPTVEVR